MDGRHLLHPWTALFQSALGFSCCIEDFVMIPYIAYLLFEATARQRNLAHKLYLRCLQIDVNNVTFLAGTKVGALYHNVNLQRKICGGE